MATTDTHSEAEEASQSEGKTLQDPQPPSGWSVGRLLRWSAYQEVTTHVHTVTQRRGTLDDIGLILGGLLLCHTHTQKIKGKQKKSNKKKNKPQKALPFLC